MRKFLTYCGMHGYCYLETITERGLSNLELENRMLYRRHSELFGSAKNRQKRIHVLYMYVWQVLFLV